MWNIVRASVRGSSHRRSVTPCQDAFDLKLRGKTLLVAISDGAGSAAYSDRGAQGAVAATLAFIEKILSDGEDFTPETGVAIVDSARTRLFELSEQLEIDVRELACTLLFAVVQENEAFFGQLGDGAWVMTYGIGLVAVTWPLRGVYANETTFLTSRDWNSAAKFVKLLGPVESFAGFTDGVQSLALHYASRSVFQPFFDPILTVLRESCAPEALDKQLQEYLSSKGVEERTDDDRTLVVATRRRFRLLGNGIH
jgi:hypothetical protein